MKKFIKDSFFKFLQILTDSKSAWKFYKPIAELNADIYYLKNEEKKKKIESDFYEKYKSLITSTVKRGPFKGLKYPFIHAIHSTIFPKLLGFYEMELHEVLKKIAPKPYRTILDVGCAEGYYAVGLAKLFPDSRIYAVDINPQALEQVKSLAKHNGIKEGEGFLLMEGITEEFLFNLDPQEKHLIFSDCEGYELTLFSEEVIGFLNNSDFIIECHDFVMPGISDLLQERFLKTHHVQLIKSIDDIFRYRHIEDPEMKKIPLQDMIKLLEEKRPNQMEWLFCEAKSPLNA
ncbi:class I SAM-dependent methyltransferase [Algoriphagus pacificus]|uniref:Methyltransferase domain-containing protein n=1 Tax=Algoriphagus pacificus TaxID=2811234 RepID=A0ABS3CKI9_9BACT|nr:class I SAM-dependent methyltransferase [Algoriphagus pacificus]MBN7817547.1 methyltransferase domain-containing protein [Algoriphagus pacificus]